MNDDLISRRAAIDVVRKWFDKIQLNSDICLDGIISLPSVTPKTEPCEDCVSREFMYKLGAKCIAARNENNVLVAIASIESLPSITPQPKIGRWIHKEDMDYIDKNKVTHNHFMCQDCGFIHDFIDGYMGQYKYCPSCGAKMEVEK